MLNDLILLSESATAAANGSDVEMTVLEKLGLGGSVTVLGLAIVFVGLVLLIFITLLYPKIAKALISWSASVKERRSARKAERQMAKQQRKAAQKTDKTVAPSKVEESAAAMSAQIPDAEHGPELIAVITAAIAASLGTSSNGIVIRALRRSQSTTPAWGVSNRIEQVNNRL